MKSSHIQFVIFCFLLMMCACKHHKSSSSQPNVLLILTDDQGYGDLSMNGNQYAETPQLDQLVEQGVYASHFYVSPVCAPTRASLLTGRYHQRTGVSGVTRGREDMNLDEVTIANILKENGYTTGIFGKWHNGAHYPYHPLGRGFDSFVGFTSGHWSNYFNTTIEKDGKPFLAEGYLTDVLTTEAIDFMEQSSKSGQPFFCYVPYQAPHTPVQVPDKYFDKYKAKGLDDFNAAIYGMNENIDWNVGRLYKTIEELGVLENTIIIYLSDNGPLNYRYNAGLKGKKGGVDEGGVRVPFIMNWKGHIEANHKINQSLAHIDLLPTLIDLLEIDYHPINTIDGVSFTPLLFGDTTMQDRPLFNEFFGRGRLLADPYLYVEDGLYDIRKDPNQHQNLKTEKPDVYKALQSQYHQFRSDLPSAQDQVKYIPVGYNAYPITTLPAHEANLYPPFAMRKDRRHTGIAYHSLYGWAHDWIDFWTSTDAHAYWNIRVEESGTYQVLMEYALAPENVGVSLDIAIGDAELAYTVDVPFEHSEYVNYDRVLRDVEAPETNWASTIIGQVSLSKGEMQLTVKSKSIPGLKSIELKSVQLIKQQ